LLSNIDIFIDYTRLTVKFFYRFREGTWGILLNLKIFLA